MINDNNSPKIEKSNINTKYGDFIFHCFSWSSHEEDNILVLTKLEIQNGCFVRIQSACYTGEIFSSSDCDCHDQLEESLNIISQNGGVFIYMLCDGRGAGLLTKTRALHLWESEGIDTAEAYKKLGVKIDPRTYDNAAYILKHFKLSRIRLLTNNPRKIIGIQSHNIEANRVSLEVQATEKSEKYLRTKAEKMGHLLSQFPK